LEAFLSRCDVTGWVMVHSPHVSFDLLVGAACRQPLAGAVGASAPRPALRFKVVTLAFPNELRVLHPDKPDLYANWCFILARTVTQFLKFARFEPGGPRLEAAAYTALVRRVVSHWPWREPLPPSARVAIPGCGSGRSCIRPPGASSTRRAGRPSSAWSSPP
jgi:hypothetical protein